MRQTRPRAEATSDRTTAKISDHRSSLRSPAVAWFCAASLAGNLATIDSLKIHQLQRSVCAAALVTVTALLSASAQAGQCPADKVSLGARTSSEMKPKDVTDNV